MVYRFGDCTLDTQRHRLQRAGQPMRLRSKVFQVLLYLLEHRDRTVLKQELCEQVWPQSFISEATLESTMRAVRQAIGDSGRAQQLIQTVYGYGYRVIAAVEVGSDVPPDAAGEALRLLPGSASAPPPDDDLNMALVPRMPGSAGGSNGHRATGIGDEGGPTPQKVAAALAPERPAVPSPVLAIECTFPTATEGEAAASEPWTAASRWEQALVATVQGLGGIVLQRSPSLLLVAFGVPQTLEQLPQRAVQAAFALRQLVMEGADSEPCPELRLVVHWGPLLVDVEASDPSAQLRAIGETLAWPVRLLGQAAPGEILLSPEMGPLVGGWCEVQAREVLLHGGQPGRIGVYAVVGNRPPWSRLEMHGRRPLSRFVGRDQELATLRERLQQVEGGRGQVVGIIGEPGVGKSRLCYEFIRGSLAPPWLILETQGTAYGQATPYLPIIDLLKGYFRIEDRDGLPTVRDKVTAKLRGLDDALTPTAAAFLTLFDVPVEDLQWQALEAPQRRQRTLDAVKRLLLWESQVQPLYLVFEDLQWIDSETQTFLDSLIESLPMARILLLVSYRPEYEHGWGNKTYYTQLRLDPLPSESAEELLQALLGDDASLTPLKRFLIERTDGNPFFLEESVWTIVETQVLVGERGTYRRAKPIHSIQVPATVQAVLAARIDRLPPADKRLLQTAAVIGTEVPFALLQAIADLAEEVLRRALTDLQAAEFLYETHLFPELEYTFKHALTHEVAYDSLLQERRRALHASIVEALEAFAGDRVAEQVERLAHHALRGEVWEKAMPYCRHAGEKAMARSAYREAVGSFEQALSALRHLPEQRDTLEQAIDLRLALRSALWESGDLGRIGALLRETGALAEALDDPRRLGEVSAFLSNHCYVMGSYGQATALGTAYTLGGRVADAVPLLVRAMEQSIATETAGFQTLCRLSLGEAQLLAGCLEEAQALTERALEHAREHQERGNQAYALRLLGEIAARRDPPECEQAEAHYQQALALADELGMRPLTAHCHLGLGKLYLKVGRPEQARAELSAAIDLYRAMEMTFWLPQAKAALAQIGR